MRQPMTDDETLASFAVAWWWVVGGPGSASWRAGFGLVITEWPRRHVLIPRASINAELRARRA